MALWDSGIWDSSKWSTIETTVAIPLADIVVASTGKVVHSGALELTLDDIDVASSGVITHHAAVALTLDDLVIASSGSITRHATVELTLDDIDVASTGKVVHAGPLSLILDDVTYSSTGQIVHNASIAIALDDIVVYFQTSTPQHRGGVDKKKTKSKTYVDLRKQVEDDVATAIAKVTGESEVVEIVEAVEIPGKVLEVDYSAQIQEILLKAQATALQAEIERLIQEELDDEEALMLLL